MISVFGRLATSTPAGPASTSQRVRTEQPRRPGVKRIPVVALTGHLGAGKTTVLNHVLGHPGARIGVVINDFGDINVDATLVTGQVDEPASIAGGCLCCLADDQALDEAPAKL